MRRLLLATFVPPINEVYPLSPVLVYIFDDMNVSYFMKEQRKQQNVQVNAACVLDGLHFPGANRIGFYQTIT